MGRRSHYGQRQWKLQSCKCKRLSPVPINWERSCTHECVSIHLYTSARRNMPTSLQCMHWDVYEKTKLQVKWTRTSEGSCSLVKGIVSNMQNTFVLAGARKGIHARHFTLHPIGIFWFIYGAFSFVVVLKQGLSEITFPYLTISPFSWFRTKGLIVIILYCFWFVFDISVLLNCQMCSWQWDGKQWRAQAKQKMDPRRKVQEGAHRPKVHMCLAKRCNFRYSCKQDCQDFCISKLSQGALQIESSPESRSLDNQIQENPSEGSRSTILYFPLCFCPTSPNSPNCWEKANDHQHAKTPMSQNYQARHAGAQLNIN